ncbi:hypothetical protein GW755_03045 [bacterium]|nr:hypothetical protein [bacterium]
MAIITFLRQFRVGEYALFDIAVSFLGVYLIAPLLSKILLKFGLNVLKISWMFLTLPLSIATHLLVGALTPMTINFIDLKGHYVLKVFILSLLFLGINQISATQKKK